MSFPLFRDVYKAISPVQKAFVDQTRSLPVLQRDAKALLRQYFVPLTTYGSADSGQAQKNFLASVCVLLARLFTEEEFLSFYDTNPEGWNKLWLLPDADTPAYFSEDGLLTAELPLSVDEPSLLVRRPIFPQKP